MMKCMEIIHFFVGVNFEQSEEEVNQSKNKSIIKLIARIGLQDTNAESKRRI